MSQFNKIMIFIDGSYIFHSCKRYNFEINYEAFMNLLRKDRNIIRTNYYSGVRGDIPQQTSFLKLLRHFEIQVITKLLKKRTIICDRCKYVKQTYMEKGIDVSLSTDLLWYACQNSYDIGIIITGDADFLPTIERVRLVGKKIELWGFRNEIEDNFEDKVDNIYYMDDIMSKIKR